MCGYRRVVFSILKTKDYIEYKKFSYKNKYDTRCYEIKQHINLITSFLNYDFEINLLSLKYNV